MFGRKFGLKEAKAASEFTKTEDTRRSVLGILGVFGIKNTVLAEANVACKKNTTKVDKSQTKAAKLELEQNRLEGAIIAAERDCENIQDVVRDWVL
jgi:hypothetical protein